MADDRPLQFEQYREPSGGDSASPTPASDPSRTFEPYPYQSSADQSPTAEESFRWENPPAQGFASSPLDAAVREPGGSHEDNLSRRGLLGAVGIVGVVSVLVIGGMAAAGRVGSEQTAEAIPDWGDGSDAEDTSDVISLGDLSLAVPDGWTAEGNDDTRAVLTKGSNQILILTFDGASGPATTELLVALDHSDSPFRGPVGTVRDDSTGGVEWARSTASGTSHGKPARQLAALGLDPSSDSAILVRQILTAKPHSVTADEAAQVLSDIRDGWPA